MPDLSLSSSSSSGRQLSSEGVSSSASSMVLEALVAKPET